MISTIIGWSLLGFLGCAAFTALGLWATYTAHRRKQVTAGYRLQPMRTQDVEVAGQNL